MGKRWGVYSLTQRFTLIMVFSPPLPHCMQLVMHLAVKIYHVNNHWMAKVFAAWFFSFNPSIVETASKINVKGYYFLQCRMVLFFFLLLTRAVYAWSLHDSYAHSTFLKSLVHLLINLWKDALHFGMIYHAHFNEGALVVCVFVWLCNRVHLWSLVCFFWSVGSMLFLHVGVLP